MVAPLPDVPDLNWFELEIMYYLTGAIRYGNEMRLMLNEHLGDETVTTGKLYPVLKKLEKMGYIKRLKKKKWYLEDREKGVTNILTRGVERKYFEVTDEGIKAVDRALHFSSSIHFNRVMSNLHEKVRRSISDILRPMGDDITVGVLSTPTKQGIQRAIEMLPQSDSGELIFLLMGSKKDLDSDLSSHFKVDVTSFPCKFNDIPLKSNYLEAVISFTHLHDVSDPQKLIREMVRTVKPGGTFILIDIIRPDSAILEDIYRFNVDVSDREDFDGEDVVEIEEMLEDLIDDIKIENIKDLFIIHGKKTGRSKKER